MKIKRRKFLLGAGVLIPGILLGDALWFEKYFIETNEFYLGNAKKEGSNIKVLQISDLHLQKITDALFNLAKKINRLQPDLIVFTGDVIDKEDKLTILDNYLSLIDANIRKVAILGNWEYWGNVDLPALKNLYSQHNCRLLNNESVQLAFDDKHISITGLDDLLGGHTDIDAALVQYTQSDYHIILNHCPAYYDVIVEKIKHPIKADLVLSGHTHGGHINLLGYTPLIPQGSGKYVKGWYKQYTPGLYVSKGIGTSILPARFGARAEIAIFYFEK